MTECKIISKDNLDIEIYESEGIEYVALRRHDSYGKKPDLTFRRGDTAAASSILSELSELFGSGLITVAEKAGK